MLFWISSIALWAVALGLVVLALVLFRQFGLLYAGGRGLVESRGLKRGDFAPTRLVVTGADGYPVPLEWDRPGFGRSQVLLLSQQGCPIADDMIADLEELALAWENEADVLFLDRVPMDGEKTSEARRRPRELPSQRRWRYFTTPGRKVHDQFDYAASPTAYIIASDGRILARELVGGIQQISAMLAYIYDRRLEDFELILQQGEVAQLSGD